MLVTINPVFCYAHTKNKYLLELALYQVQNDYLAKALPEKMHGQKHSMLSFDQGFAQLFEELLLLPR